METDSLYDQLADEFDRLIAGYKAATADGSFSFHDGILLAAKATHRFHALAHAHAEASVEERRDAVLRAVDQFCVDVLNPMDIPGVPEIVENTVVDPALNATAHKLATVAFDFFEQLAAEAAK